LSLLMIFGTATSLSTKSLLGLGGDLSERLMTVLLNVFGCCTTPGLPLAVTLLKCADALFLWLLTEENEIPVKVDNDGELVPV
jgi:hypothetical protein